MPMPGRPHHENRISASGAGSAASHRRFDGQVELIGIGAINGRPKRAARLAGDRVEIDKLQLVDPSAAVPRDQFPIASATVANATTMSGNEIQATQRPAQPTMNEQIIERPEKAKIGNRQPGDDRKTNRHDERKTPTKLLSQRPERSLKPLMASFCVASLAAASGM